MGGGARDGWGKLVTHTNMWVLPCPTLSRHFLPHLPPHLQVITANMVDFAAPATYDRIVSIEMFEHMKNYRELLRRCSSWLKPGGKLFVHIFVHKSLPYHFEVRVGVWARVLGSLSHAGAQVLWAAKQTACLPARFCSNVWGRQASCLPRRPVCALPLICLGQTSKLKLTASLTSSEPLCLTTSLITCVAICLIAHLTFSLTTCLASSFDRSIMATCLRRLRARPTG